MKFKFGSRLTGSEKAEIKEKIKKQKLQQQTEENKKQIAKTLKETKLNKESIVKYRETCYQRFLDQKAKNNLKGAQISLKFFILTDKILKFIDILESILQTAEVLNASTLLIQESCSILKSVSNIHVRPTFGSLGRYLKKFQKVFNKFEREIDISIGQIDKAFGLKSKSKEKLSDEDALKFYVESIGLDYDNLPETGDFTVSDTQPSTGKGKKGNGGSDDGSDNGHLPKDAFK